MNTIEILIDPTTQKKQISIMQINDPKKYIACFENYEQLKKFCKKFSIPFTYDENTGNGICHKKVISKYLENEKENLKIYYGYNSNGKIVRNYYQVANDTIFLLRAKSDEKPLSLEKSEKYQKKNGIY